MRLKQHHAEEECPRAFFSRNIFFEQESHGNSRKEESAAKIANITAHGIGCEIFTGKHARDRVLFSGKRWTQEDRNQEKGCE
ncbi:MAG: hypothetical protein LBG65_08155 [Puniceicoccales bacterium]|nr:hypothetical protein [Puniceicoccales bacterium]